MYAIRSYYALGEEFRQVRDDDVGAMPAQRLGLAVAGDADHQAEAAGPPGLHAAEGILDDHGPLRLDPELPSRLEKGIGRRLAGQPRNNFV